ncbi:MAG: thioredoxin family protein [Candidatus Neomarinimicrobiota bacterium]|nr:MAG: thioredoxin family protein [Candidatus Neomarinimicrobiota bacterium]
MHRKMILALCFFTGLLAKELILGADIPLPDRKMPEISGQEISLQEALGSQGLVVIFSCNTCPWVKAWQDRYVSLAAEYQPRGIRFIAINSNAAYREKGDSFADMKTHARQYGYNFLYALDPQSELAKAFGASHTPQVFLFDAHGKLVYRGAIDDNARHPDQVERPYLKNALDELLAGKPISLPSTKALGCSIKFAE